LQGIIFYFNIAIDCLTKNYIIMKTLVKISDYKSIRRWENAVYQQIANETKWLARNRVFDWFEADTIALETITIIMELGKSGKYDRMFTDANFMKLSVYKVLNQLIVNYIRQKKARKYATSLGAVTETALTSSQSTSSDAFQTMAMELNLYSESLENVNVKRLVRNAVNSLTENKTVKRVLIGFYLLNLKQTEIEQKFDIKRNTVKSIIRRNRGTLKKSLQYLLN